MWDNSQRQITTFLKGSLNDDFAKLERQAKIYKELYPSGTRIMLLHMENDPRHIPDNMRGTVEHVDDLGTLHCSFDNGRRLGIIPGEDQFRKLSESELQEEQNVCQEHALSEPTM